MEHWKDKKDLKDKCTAFVIFNKQADAQVCLEELPKVLSQYHEWDIRTMKSSRAPEPSDVIFSGLIKETKQKGMKIFFLVLVVCSLSLPSIYYHISICLVTVQFGLFGFENARNPAQTPQICGCLRSKCDQYVLPINL